MVFKKTISMALLPLVCISLFACKHSDGDMGKSDINFETAATEHPFRDGYYVGENYTLQLVYMGNKAEHSYGVSVLDNNTGDEEFFGLVYNVSDKATVLTIPGYSNQSSMLMADKIKDNAQECVVKITDMSDEGINSAICGEYEYSGDTWCPQAAVDADVITPGIYVRDGYILTVEYEDGEMRFIISDNDGALQFEGTRSVGEYQNTVMVGKGENIYRFAKCYNTTDGAHIEVSIIGYYTDCDYLGNFKPAN